jgi:ABC-2 type transport system permease protein
VGALPEHLSQSISFTEEVVFRLYAHINFLFLFFIPLITMKLLSEEIKDETIDIYWLAQIKEWQIVIAKSLAAFTVVLSMMILTCLYPLIIWGVGIHDFNLILTCNLAVLLNSLCYISLCLFCSSLTGNQIISALLSVVSILLLWMISWGSHLNSNYLLSEIFGHLGVTSHFEKILRGLLGTQDLLYYVTFILFFSFLTAKSLGKRSWI